MFSELINIDHVCRLVPNDEVKNADYNLSVSTYVEPEDTMEKVDIVKLNAEIKEIVDRDLVLRDEIDKFISECFEPILLEGIAYKSKYHAKLILNLTNRKLETKLRKAGYL